jgi:hypothetical protein
MAQTRDEFLRAVEAYVEEHYERGVDSIYLAADLLDAGRITLQTSAADAASLTYQLIEQA